MRISATITIALLGHFAAGAAFSSASRCPDKNGTQFKTHDGEIFYIECGIAHPGGDLPAPNGLSQPDLKACIESCAANDQCRGVAFAPLPHAWSCTLKGEIGDAKEDSSIWSALRRLDFKREVYAYPAPANDGKMTVVQIVSKREVKVCPAPTNNGTMTVVQVVSGAPQNTLNGQAYGVPSTSSQTPSTLITTSKTEGTPTTSTHPASIHTSSSAAQAPSSTVTSSPTTSATTSKADVPSNTSTPSPTTTATTSKAEVTSTTSPAVQPTSPSPIPSPTREVSTPNPIGGSNGDNPAGGSAGELALNSGKRGVAYNRAKYTGPFSQPHVNSKVSWAYNWFPKIYNWDDINPRTTSDYNAALEFVPMLPKLSVPDLINNWNDFLPGTLQTRKVIALLGFNEPDAPGADQIAPDVAATNYRNYITKYANGNLQLGSPAVRNDEAGIPWLQSFMGDCSDCKIDFVVAHYYDQYDGQVVQRFQNYIDKFYKTFNKPVWVTEFALHDSSEEQQETFLKAAIKYLDKNPNVHRYAYYMSDPHPVLPGVAGTVNNDGSLTAIGHIYDNYPAGCTNFYYDSCA